MTNHTKRTTDKGSSNAGIRARAKNQTSGVYHAQPIRLLRSIQRRRSIHRHSRPLHHLRVILQANGLRSQPQQTRLRRLAKEEIAAVKGAKE